MPATPLSRVESCCSWSCALVRFFDSTSMSRSSFSSFSDRACSRAIRTPSLRASACASTRCMDSRRLVAVPFISSVNSARVFFWLSRSSSIREYTSFRNASSAAPAKAFSASIRRSSRVSTSVTAPRRESISPPMTWAIVPSALPSRSTLVASPSPAGATGVGPSVVASASTSSSSRSGPFRKGNRSRILMIAPRGGQKMPSTDALGAASRRTQGFKARAIRPRGESRGAAQIPRRRPPFRRTGS